MSLAVCKMQSRLSPCHYQLQIRANFFGCQDFLSHLVTSHRLCLHSSHQEGDVLLLLTLLAPTRPFYLSSSCILSWFRSRPVHLHDGIVCSNSLLHVRDKSTRESVVVFLLLLLLLSVSCRRCRCLLLCSCSARVSFTLSLHPSAGHYTRLQQFQQLLHYEMMKWTRRQWHFLHETNLLCCYCFSLFYPWQMISPDGPPGRWRRFFFLLFVSLIDSSGVCVFYSLCTALLVRQARSSRIIRTNSMSLFSLNELRVCCSAFFIRIQSFTEDLNLNKRKNTSADAF